MKLCILALILSTAQAKRCYLRPKVTTAELKIVFPGYTIHTDALNGCELLRKVHDYRREYKVLSVLMDNKIRKAYINEEIEL